MIVQSLDYHENIAIGSGLSLRKAVVMEMKPKIEIDVTPKFLNVLIALICVILSMINYNVNPRQRGHTLPIIT